MKSKQEILKNIELLKKLEEAYKIASSEEAIQALENAQKEKVE